MASWSSHTSTDIRRRSSPLARGVPYSINVNQPPPNPSSLYGSPSNGLAFASPGAYSQPTTPNALLDPNMSQQSSVSSSGFGSTAAHPMARFMDNSEAPYSALHLSTPTIPEGMAQGPTMTQSSSFMAMQGSARSDSASNVTPLQPIAGDSGYFTNPKTYSTGSVEPSALDSDLPDVTSSTTQTKPPKSSPKSRSGSGNGRVAPSSASQLASKHDGELECKYCSIKPRLKSELKKHILRHTRPFTCDHIDCSRHKQGFTTPNDLDRHKRSKHKVFPDTAKVYICASEQCVEQDKAWPRYDNFKQHVERMHKMEDMQSLLERSEKPASVANALGLTDGSASGIGHAAVHQHTRSRSFGKSSSARTASAQAKGTFGSAPSYDASRGLAFGGSQSNLSQSEEMSNPDSANDFDAPYNYAASVGDPRYLDYSTNQFDEQTLGSPLDSASVNHLVSFGYDDTSTMFARPPSIVVHNPHEQRQRQDLDLAHMMTGVSASSSGDGFGDMTGRDGGMADGWKANPSLHINGMRLASYNRQPLFSRYGKPPAKVYKANSVAGSRMTVVNDSRQTSERKSSGGAKCSQCNKVLARQCDLKKHERRHTRPFGCTFDLCNKQFGSKNDWKRHESSQHFQEEQWRCKSSINSQGGRQCAKIFNDWPRFKAHLCDAHGLDDSLDKLRESDRIGRNHQRTFWCGFCGMIVALEKTGRRAWDERFDHIGEHFVHGQKNIADWASPQGHRTKGQMRVEGQVGTWPSFSGVAAASAASDGADKAGNEEEERDMDVEEEQDEEDAEGEKEEDELADAEDARGMDVEAVRYCCQCYDGPYYALTGHCACQQCGHSCKVCFGRTKARQPVVVVEQKEAIGAA